MTELSSDLLTELPGALDFLTFRCQPFVVYAVCSARTSRRGAALAVLLYAALAGLELHLGRTLPQLSVGSVAMAYSALVLVGMHRAGSLVSPRRIGRRGSFLLCALAFMWLPALAVPAEHAPAVLILGWDMMLASYSYCADVADRPQERSLRSMLFFVLINPTLVYAERGHEVGPPALRADALLRVAQAIAGLCLRCLLVVLMPLALARLEPYTAEQARRWLAQLGSGLILYVTHSSVASFQIGAMLALGFRVPERYRFPFLSTSPMDFWRRWNIWVGHWALRYVFYPTSLALGRRFRRAPRWLHSATAVLVVFAFVGALHDFYFYATQLQREQRVSLAFTACFTLFGALFLVWVAAERIAAKARDALGANAESPALRTAVLVASWLCFVPALQAFAWLTSRDVLDPLFAASVGRLMPWVAWVGASAH